VTVDAMVATNTIKHPQSDTCNWYVIDVYWLDTWKAFAVLKGPRTGPINNCKLTDQFGQLRSEVCPVTDYDGVSPESVHLGNKLVARHASPLIGAGPPAEAKL